MGEVIHLISPDVCIHGLGRRYTISTGWPAGSADQHPLVVSGTWGWWKIHLEYLSGGLNGLVGPRLLPGE
jgi:hypothetical protein